MYSATPALSSDAPQESEMLLAVILEVENDVGSVGASVSVSKVAVMVISLSGTVSVVSVAPVAATVATSPTQATKT